MMLRNGGWSTKKNVSGRAFKIKMDNRTVSYHQSQKKFSSKYVQWLNYLTKFKCEFEYNSNKTKVVIDALTHKNIVAPVYIIKGLLLEHIKKRLQTINEFNRSKNLPMRKK